MIEILKNIKNKTNNIFSSKRAQVYVATFVLSLVMLLSVLISKRVFPFGDRCILRTDFYHQYLPFHTELMNKLKSFDSLYYTYNVGLGTNFITIMAYYLICPFNILLMFVGENFVLEFITVTLIIKISLASLTMAHYLTNHYNTENYQVIIMSLIYAFSGYVCAYYWNIMWMDNIWLFPLLILGFEKMFYKNKPFLYIITLGISIMCNYYIAIISCFYLVIYFIIISVVSCYKIKTIIKKLLFTFIYSVIGIMLSAIILVPVIMAFKTTASSDTHFPTRVYEYFSIVEVLARHLPYVKVENGIKYWPNIYSSVLSLGLIPLYFLNKKTKKRDKITYGIVLLFFIASFSINVMDFVWHICKFPNSLPCRQSFIYDFVIATICLKPLLKLNDYKKEQLLVAFSIPLVFIMLASKSIENDYVKYYSIYFANIFLFIYMIVFANFKKSKIDNTICVLIVLIVVELFTNLQITSFTTINRNDYMKNTDSMKRLASDIKMMNNDFYRIDRDEMRTKDDGAFMNFPTASIFSSAAYASGTKYYKQMGMEASTNAYSLTGSTPLMDAILGVKYQLREGINENAKDLDKVLLKQDEKVCLYENKNTLPLSYVLSKQFLEDYEMSSGNPATNQNNFARSCRYDAVLVKQDVNIKNKNASAVINEDGDYYLFVRDKSIKNIQVVYPTTTKVFKNVDRGFFAELGYLTNGTELEFKNDSNDNQLLVELFRFDYSVLQKVVNKINKNYDFHMNKFESSSIEYQLDSKIDDGIMIITLPFDDGFDVFVDGKKADKIKIFDFFLGVNVDKGSHNIKIKYVPSGLYIGAIISVFGILAMLSLFIVMKYSNKNYKRKYK